MEMERYNQDKERKDCQHAVNSAHWELFNSDKKHHVTKEPVLKPDIIFDFNRTMGGVDLLSWVLIPYSSQRHGVKWYRKLEELLLDVSVYNSFIVFKKWNA